MPIDIRGISGNPPLHAHVTTQLAGAVGRLRVKPVGVQALFFDENGPKGGIDIRCALTVRLPYRPSVRVEHLGETHRRAFDEAFAALERQLARYAERARESRRRPKKYYAANRLLASGHETAAKPAPRAT